LEVLGESGAKKLLDCPTGEGPFAQLLVEQGFNVSCCDIFPSQFKLSEISCEFADLNDRLPYGDNTFDAVACLNGLQRVWARGRAVRELARVVKPGGNLIISFPNNADIRRRLLYMMTGSVTWNVIGPPHVCVPDAEDPAASFRYPMTLANVLSAIKSVGLQCESVRSTHFSLGALLLSPLVIGPKIFSFFSPKHYKKFYMMKETSTLDALLGAWLVVIAKKPINKPINS
jgi:SAM-dependent methyltransferase